MDALSRMAIEHECAALAHAFGYHLDQRDYEAVIALFTDDGVWKRYGVDLKGREALLGAMNQRSLTQLTRHLVTNVYFTEVREDRCRAVTTIVVFFNGDAVDTPALLPSTDSTVVMDFHDSFVRGPTGWRFEERDTRPIFLPPPLLAAITGQR